MSKVGILCADGLEEVECLTVVDFLRRAGIEITMISIEGRKEIRGAHQIHFLTDRLFDEVNFEELDGLILPGGGEGTQRLEAFSAVPKLAEKFSSTGRLTAAICAAPGIFARAGILNGKKATMYPGMEPQDCGVEWTGEPVVREGNIITGKGPAKAGVFAIELIRYLEGEETAKQVADGALLD